MFLSFFLIIPNSWWHINLCRKFGALHFTTVDFSGIYRPPSRTNRMSCCNLNWSFMYCQLFDVWHGVCVCWWSYELLMECWAGLVLFLLVHVLYIIEWPRRCKGRVYEFSFMWLAAWKESHTSVVCATTVIGHLITQITWFSHSAQAYAAAPLPDGKTIYFRKQLLSEPCAAPWAPSACVQISRQNKRSATFETRLSFLV